MDSEQPTKKAKMATSRDIDTYCAFMFSNENVKATRVLVSQLLNEVRERKKIKDEEDFLWIAKESHPMSNYREQVTDYDLSTYGDISLFKLSLSELNMGPHENSEKILWMLRQCDGFSCAGAVLLTCTAGLIKVPPTKITQILTYMTRNNPWESQKEMPMRDLPIEGMGRLIHEVMGIIPAVMCGRVAQEIESGVWEKLDEDDNLFNDEKRFTKLMRIVRFASICCNSPAHWYSIVCIPVEDETIFMVCDSLRHTAATAYPSYNSLRRYFLLPKTKPTATEPDLNTLPLTLSIYPVLQAHEGASKEAAAFMEGVIRKTVEAMEKEEVPFVDWKEVATLLDQEQ